ncbi:MAG TPA: exostosin family protein [Candidatus Paceibacterota bacterium]|nr:exostosin family protein [Candidatus Paceibacterota bacterium]
MEPVRLYVGPDYKEPQLYTYVELLFPFWGVAAKESMPYVRAAATQYQYSKNDFVLVDDIKDADYVLMPYHYERLMAVNPEKVARIVREAQEAGKPLLIDGSGDIEHVIDIPNTVVLRVSQYRYAVKENEITVPFLAEDLLESFRGGIVELRIKMQTPSVGFTGWADISFITRLKIFVKEFSITLGALFDEKRGAEHKGLLFRARALKALQKTKGIVNNFTIRKSYSGHSATIQGAVKDNRQAFVDALIGSDYALVVRGDANASVRFYEALSLGRIPLFLDTACVLPLEDRINYRDFCVFVDWRDTDQIGENLVKFHQSVTSERFVEMQHRAREAYQNYLRIDAFSAHLADMLRARLTIQK